MSWVGRFLFLDCPCCLTRFVGQWPTMKDIRAVVVRVRVTQEELTRLRKRAAAEGRSVSNLIRLLLFKKENVRG